MSRLGITIQEILEWQEKNFPNNEAWKPLLGLVEEVGELSHHFLKKAQGIRVNEDHDAGMADAVGDIFIYLIDFCKRNNLNLEACITYAWQQVQLRDWTKYKENGHGQ